MRGVAALMLRAGCAGAALNVRINLGSLTDTAFVQKITEQYTGILNNVETQSLRVLAEVDLSIGGK